MTSPLVLRDRIDSFPTDQVAGYNVRPGRTFPFGATLVPGGVNFSIFSSGAEAVSLVLFRRDGWGREHWTRWAKDLMAAGTAFVAPTTHKGEAVGRLVFMHPSTPSTVIDEIMVSLTG